MRKNLPITILLLLCFYVSYAQQTDTLPATVRQRYESYLKTGSTYNKVGWILFGTGAALFGTAYLINVSDGWNGHTKAEDLFTVAVVMAGAGVPCFIIGAVNKRKAKLVLKTERVTSAEFLKPFIPAVAVRISL